MKKHARSTPNWDLKAARELRAYTQADLAAELGTSPKTVSRWERGETLPLPYFRRQLCLVLNKNLHELGLIGVTDHSQQEER